VKKISCILLLLGIIAACSNEPKDTYTVEEANEQGDVVVEVENKNSTYSNLGKMIQFMIDVEANKSTSVQISIFQSESPLIKKIEFDGSEFVVTDKNNNKEKVYTCDSVADWSGQFLAEGCTLDGKAVEGAVRLFEVSQYEYNKAKQKVKFENKDQS
jgi:hypothetical protein